MPGNLMAPPSDDQIAKIRELSLRTVGDADVILEAVGYPEDAYSAGRILGAIHKVRNQGLGGKQDRIDLVVDDIGDSASVRTYEWERTPETPVVDDPRPAVQLEAQPAGINHRTGFGPETAKHAKKERKEAAVATTKTCTRCGDDKPIDDFYKNQGRCKPCFAIAAKERKAAKEGKKPAAKSDKPAEIIPEKVTPRASLEEDNVFAPVVLHELVNRPAQIVARTDPVRYIPGIDLADPPYSKIRELDDALGEIEAETGEATIESAFKVWRKVMELAGLTPPADN